VIFAPKQKKISEENQQPFKNVKCLTESKESLCKHEQTLLLQRNLSFWIVVVILQNS